MEEVRVELEEVTCEWKDSHISYMGPHQLSDMGHLCEKANTDIEGSDAMINWGMPIISVNSMYIQSRGGCLGLEGLQPAFNNKPTILLENV